MHPSNHYMMYIFNRPITNNKQKQFNILLSRERSAKHKTELNSLLSHRYYKYLPPAEQSFATVHVVSGSNPFSMASIICGASFRHC